MRDCDMPMADAGRLRLFTNTRHGFTQVIQDTQERTGRITELGRLQRKIFLKICFHRPFPVHHCLLGWPRPR